MSLAMTKPSEVTNSYWLYAHRKHGVYPKHSEKGGKWLIFIPLQQIDTVWEKVKNAVEQGNLGYAAKVSTARKNPNAVDSETKVICVYTYDWTDESDVRRIREGLRKLGVISKIPYKADRETHLGLYTNRGHKRIAIYYE